MYYCGGQCSPGQKYDDSHLSQYHPPFATIIFYYNTNPTVIEILCVVLQIAIFFVEDKVVGMSSINTNIVSSTLDDTPSHDNSCPHCTCSHNKSQSMEHQPYISNPWTMFQLSIIHQNIWCLQPFCPLVCEVINLELVWTIYTIIMAIFLPSTT